MFIQKCSTKVTHGRIHDFPKPSLISWIETNSGTIDSTTIEDNLISTQNQHHAEGQYLGSLCGMHLKEEGLPCCEGIERRLNERKRNQKNKNMVINFYIYLVFPMMSIRFTYSITHVSVVIQKI